MIEKYFFEELQYLRDAGREFAQAYPEIARYLNIEDIDDRDPYVERLFEGFAFLTGRIRQKLDDELPEFTRSLLGLIWPHFLRPIPSLSILEFQPRPGTIQEMHVIRRDTEIDSASVRGEIVCHFRTCYDVQIRPINLEEVILRPSNDGNSVICFRFRMDEGVEYHNLGFDTPLRLFIHDLDAPTIYALHMFLTHNVQSVVIQTYGDEKKVTLPGQTGVQPVGFALEDGLLPYTDYSFPGYRLLQEYFAYRDKFFFFDLCGLDKLQPKEEMEGFEVQILFNSPFPRFSGRLRAENFRLHCTPIINLFSRDAEPIRVNYLDAEYRVIADVIHPDSIEVYSVNAVEGIVTGTEERRTYVPFYSFKHGLDISVRKQTPRYYHTSTRPRIKRRDITPDLSLGLTKEGEFGGLDTYISIVNAHSKAKGQSDFSDIATESPVEETLSIEVTCTNGRWPRELNLGDICYPTPAVPEFVTFKNLTRPTLPIYPPFTSASHPCFQRFEWNLISHLALNYLSLADDNALRGLLELYEWSQTESNRRRIASIRSVSFEPKEIIYRGSVIRGIIVKLEVVRENFEFGEGDLYLFGLVMSEFLSLYASINSFVQLQLECPSGELFKWPPKTGKSHLI